MPSGTAQKDGVLRRASKAPSGLRSRIVSVLPCAITPVMCEARPARYALTPTTALKSAPAFGNRGLRLRSIAYLKLSAVTRSFEGGDKRKPPRTTNV